MKRVAVDERDLEVVGDVLADSGFTAESGSGAGSVKTKRKYLERLTMMQDPITKNFNVLLKPRNK